MTSENGGEIEILDDQDEHAYMIHVDGRRVGKAVYHMRGGRHFFVHTEIDPDMNGRGLGRRLVEFALEDVKAKNGTVVPICPFFRAYLKRHPEYDELIDHEILARIERVQQDD